MRLAELEIGQMAKADGEFWVATNGGYVDEIGVSRYPKNYDASATIIQRRKIISGQELSVIIYGNPQPWNNPNWTMIVQEADGYRHKLPVKDSGLSVDFLFRSTDPRITHGIAKFTCRSGNFIRAICQAHSFSFNIDEAGKIFCAIIKHDQVVKVPNHCA
jgi:hypothetical protein